MSAAFGCDVCSARGIITPATATVERVEGDGRGGLVRVRGTSRHVCADCRAVSLDYGLAPVAPATPRALLCGCAADGSAWCHAHRPRQASR